MLEPGQSSNGDTCLSIQVSMLLMWLCVANLSLLLPFFADSVLINLLGGKGNPLPDERPDGPEIFSFAQDLAKNILDEAIMAGYNLVIDMAMPSESTLLALQQRGYRIDFAIMEVSAGVARKREVSRDLLQLGWGRAGESPLPPVFR